MNYDDLMKLSLLETNYITGSKPNETESMWFSHLHPDYVPNIHIKIRLH